MDGLDLLHYKWLAKAQGYSELLDEINLSTDPTVSDIKIILLAKMKVINDIIQEDKTRDQDSED